MARPMIVEITSRLENPQGFDKIDDMQRRMKSFRPIFNDVRQDLEEAWTKNFDTQGGHYGGWKPLSPKYAAWRGSPEPILIRSGTNKMPKRPIIFEPRNAANKWGKWAVKYIADGETFGIKG